MCVIPSQFRWGLHKWYGIKTVQPNPNLGNRDNRIGLQRCDQGTFCGFRFTPRLSGVSIYGGGLVVLSLKMTCSFQRHTPGTIPTWLNQKWLEFMFEQENSVKSTESLTRPNSSIRSRTGVFICKVSSTTLVLLHIC